MLNTIKSVMLGHAVGDALGVPFEFCDRAFLQNHPVTDMMGFGTYNVPAGTWSDDTSMSLCALDILANGTINYEDIMKNFGKWYYDGYFTATGEVFDIGNTCCDAIHNYFDLGYNATECGLANERTNGNGSLMRIHPFVLYAYYNRIEGDNFVGLIMKASSLTHAHQYSLDGCVIYAYVLKGLLEYQSKDFVYIGLEKAKHWIRCKGIYSRVLNGDISAIPISEIKSSGYVVSSLEAAIWCLLTTESYSDCVLKAVNLGGDTDTIAAIAGGLAGALYGIDDIPQNWMNTLKRRDYIEHMCENAYDAWRKINVQSVRHSCTYNSWR